MSSRTSFQNSATGSSASASSLVSMADPPLRQMDGAAVDYFLIEMVHTLRASSAVATARAKKVERDMIEAGLLPSPPPASSSLRDVQRDSAGSLASRGGGKATVEDEDEGVRTRLEAIGMHVGANMTERLCHDRGLFADTLDAVKFICKDLWAACWDKQVDNLRTNHRGIYVLQDHTFKPIARISSWEGRAEALKKAKLYVTMSAGILRGALVRLGYQATVVPEVTVLPQCSFQLRLPKGP
ncbi:transport protein particle component [Laetiporus sulphureus 93-53]|uniref:Transport protein particle component n=1 Tax=Laetiporus sulphureus 93-53 TaxID=1314785 RepID=A0A165FJH0_9APHY|nr:transport protein particle component [Laetiporus sulphureus 93-53]KZT09064.1 transport protein particle component [Laetiporus sulphureus 93-53]